MISEIVKRELCTGLVADGQKLSNILLSIEISFCGLLGHEEGQK